MASEDSLVPKKDEDMPIEKKYIRLLEQHNHLLSEHLRSSATIGPVPVGPRRLSTTALFGDEPKTPVDKSKEEDTDDENTQKIRYRMKRFNKEGFQIEEKHDPKALEDDQTNTTGRVATFVYHFSQTNNHYETQIKIESEPVRCLLQDQLENYPGYHWKNNALSLFSPFQPLIHNEKRLLQAIEANPDDEGCSGLLTILEAIKPLKEVKEYFDTRGSDDDSVAFDFLWTIFPPGEIVLLQSSFMKEKQAFLVRECYPREDSETDRPYMSIVCWAYDWDGVREKFDRVAVELRIDTFKGRRLITSLPCYPLRLCSNVESVKEELIRRGKRFRDLCMRRTGKQMFEYDGSAYSRGTGVRHLQRGTSGMLKGKVMIDFASYVQHGPEELVPMGDLVLADRDENDECRCDVCNTEGGPRDNQKYFWDDNDGEADTSFSDEQYLICPPRVLGYHLMEKKWVELQVNKVADIEKFQFSDAFEKLQLNLKKKNLIRDLVRGHTQDKELESTPRNRMNDLTKGKGEGLVILLHGPPGVGKTLTAESIAQATEKPLFPIGVGDVTTDPSQVEKRLEQLFELAEAWQAVMLFDEADVFLESRATTTDVTRVGLVSVLLRVLEYYQGILILTTNRIRSFDIAVQSRINLAIKFEDLTEKQKKTIFRNLLSQLDDDSVKNKGALLRWMDDDDDASSGFSNLNGRQVRNIVFSAASLAGNRKPPDNKLDIADVKEMLAETVNFQKHLHELTKAARDKNE
ncbi:hypothetical protein NPX13_g7934 [Xylaria arbuscula]|uniref:AAA+ ATPase domain-containing protein n=1 Tax=Xylaria arbuscula TaxID=114810 RepID=A0A9W8N9X8_9PEZI|nr:hypothetical protein NPX13_g7934 [Xylaria arbuscula]